MNALVARDYQQRHRFFSSHVYQSSADPHRIGVAIQLCDLGAQNRIGDWSR
jgi:hypothetical protein